MEAMKSTENIYLKPELEVIQINIEGILCQSTGGPGGGGTEGTEDEPLYP